MWYRHNAGGKTTRLMQCTQEEIQTCPNPAPPCPSTRWKWHQEEALDADQVHISKRVTGLSSVCVRTGSDTTPANSDPVLTQYGSPSFSFPLVLIPLRMLPCCSPLQTMLLIGTPVSFQMYPFIPVHFVLCFRRSPVWTFATWFSHYCTRVPGLFIATFTSVVGSYIGVHWMYAPGLLGTNSPVYVANTPMYEVIGGPVMLGVTLV